MRNEEELTNAIKQLCEVLGLVADENQLAALAQLPLDRAAAICSGVEAGTTGLRFTIDFAPGQKLEVACSALEEGKETRLFKVGDFTHNLGPAKLFVVKKDADTNGGT